MFKGIEERCEALVLSDGACSGSLYLVVNKNSATAIGEPSSHR